MGAGASAASMPLPERRELYAVSAEQGGAEMDDWWEVGEAHIAVLIMFLLAEEAIYGRIIRCSYVCMMTDWASK